MAEVTVNPYYPTADTINETAKDCAEAFPESVPSDSCVYQDGCRSSLLWRLFHFAFASHVAHPSNLCRHWLAIPEFLESKHIMRDPERDLTERDGMHVMENFHSRNDIVVDVDLQDATGKMFALKIVWMASGPIFGGFCGLIGKVFDRNHPSKEELFEIYIDDEGEKEVRATHKMHGLFVEYDTGKEAFGGVFRFLQGKSGFFIAKFQSQAEFLIACALFVALDYPMEPQIQNSQVVAKQLLQNLGKYDETSRHNKHNMAAHVLCGTDGYLRNIISSYAAEQYVPVFDLDCDRTLDWYLVKLQPLVQALRCLKEGDRVGAYQAMRTFEKNTREPDCHQPSIFSDHRALDKFSNRRNAYSIEEILEDLRPLTLGLEDHITRFYIDTSELMEE